MKEPEKDLEKHTILLFYKYTDIDDPVAETERQRAVLSVLGITGRFIVAGEGINGTGEGTADNVQKYIDWMQAQKIYKNIHWKLSEGTGHAFPRLSVKCRKEIVSLHLGADDDIDPKKLTGQKLTPSELNEWYNPVNGEKRKDFYIVDMRNDYELKVGKFEGTVFPGMRNFRDLRKKLDVLQDLKNKTVLTVCTGGVRCEKASGLLKKEGFKDVYQLDGGIVSYMAKYPNQNYKGALYVFDGRETMHFDGDGHEVIGECDFCQTKTENYSNCNNIRCNQKMLVCTDCVNSGPKYCSDECKVLVTEKVYA
ncbi:hypothetical protein A3J61_01590 [Candidatus Nomurabacteria bacterium RIFCSPHIGHO2_02_FULL_38_15]|uniref:tRNA uridine(34) hydroxylase n=1 Tax=Candidatus Nomurabacteria bacterium RIFCSPHIGHO2_02_FULL_38_15 TaxID=1801752 RepID=A0A1F6VQW4_9BACT|nr:MAG: hypothetical protein A3J61_01590 [Candidatus Nomurabacteria bacterium RIFCSPHIGHO2_02_FULL_38_15]